MGIINAISFHLFQRNPKNFKQIQNLMMPNYYCSNSILSFLSFIILFSTSNSVQPSPQIRSYNEIPIGQGVGIVELRRAKRGDGEGEMLDFGKPGELMPSDYEIHDENEEGKMDGKTAETTEHTYYNMTIHSGDEDTFAGAYVDVPLWIKQGGAEGQTEHNHLDDAYRKAAGVRLKFEFPFYGHRLQNLTIATGGFLYVGDQTHSWLAATQYIAPLMANFDTSMNQSSIQYADDGKRMIVEWKDVTLRDNRPAGNFSFQVHLWRNGNITFVYKEVPITIGNISDVQHPCKLGISDAYLFNHKVSSITPSAPQSKRVIHEYHRITIPNEKIISKTVVMLKALPICLEATSCEDCIKKQLKQFKCSWCNPKENGKGGKGEDGSQDGTTDSKPFCSDQLGLHRRRQEWIEGHCQIQEENQYCKADEVFTNNVTITATPEAAKDLASSTPMAPPSSSNPPESTTVINAKGAASARSGQSENGNGTDGSGGIAFVTFFMLAAISATVWVAYAYFNPHTRSGQLLIKYRPSKWQIPSSHVRYSASVHM